MVQKIIFWISTGLISLMMLSSGYAYFADPAIASSFKHLGFPDYFRVELGIAKVVGVLILIIPAIPARIKEWAYAGFVITFISAFIAHLASNDPVSTSLFPLIALGLLLVSYFYRSKLAKAA